MQTSPISATQLCRGLTTGVVVLVLAAASGLLRAQPTVPVMTLRAIVASSPDEARRAVDRVAAGEPFDSVARAVSIDASAERGGLIGTLEPAALRRDVRDALAGLQPGQVSPVVAIPTGFVVFQVADPQPGAPLPASDTAVVAAIRSTGSVKYVPDIGGLPEAEALLRDFPKAADWNASPRSICQARQDSLAAGESLFERFLANLPAAGGDGRQSFEVMQAHLGYAQILAYQGSMARAVPHFDQAFRMAAEAGSEAAPLVEKMLAVALLHKAGMDNNVFRAPGDLCLFPPPPGKAFERTTDLERAYARFLSLLERRPDDLEARWLANVAAGMLGRYPLALPPELRLPPEAFRSADDVGRFRDVAVEAGLNVFASAGGVVVDDLTGDGHLDVVTSNFYSCGPVHLFAGNGDGTYTEQTAAAGLRDQVGGLNVVQADYDNDGCTDLLLQRGGWEVPQRSSLLRNTCRGGFTDVTLEAGLAPRITSTQAVAWADIDNDGWLDLFVANENSEAQLFRSQKNGRFLEAGATAGIAHRSFAKGVAAADFDNDGYVDFYVSNYDGPNFLYRNNRNGTFTDVSATAGAPGPGRGFATWAFDYDNDGWQDLFATSYFMSVDETARTYLGLPHNAETLKLYRNVQGRFEDVTQRVGLDKVFMPMGSNFGDIDNDGFLDIYLGMGNPSYAAVLPHVLLRNREGRTFVDVTASSGTGEIHKGHGVAFADLDRDGDQDIVAEIGGATPGDSHAMRVFENPGRGNDWLAVRVSGARTNRSAIGARIAVTVTNGGGPPRTLHRVVGSGGSFGASPLEQHIGLGRSAQVVDLEVWWPASGERQHFANVAVNQAVSVLESSPTLSPVTRQAVRLGGARRTN